jgi:serine/threonine protein kinase
MCQNCSQVGDCHTRFHVGHLGLQGPILEGCIRDPMFLKQIVVPCKQNPINENIYINDIANHRTLEWTQNLPGTATSRVELGLRNGTTYAFIKRPMIAGKSLLYEACIQQMVKESLVRGGFPRGAAAVYDVFRLNDNSICFSMEVFAEAIPLSILLQNFKGSITNLILNILLQLCAMLWHLSVDLGMNHRDLKPSNLMIEEHALRPLTLKVGNQSITIQSGYTISLIDFGFSCIGNTDTRKSDIAIGDVYSFADPCPKDGRDLYMFLAFLYTDCGLRIGKDLRDCFGKWLQNGTTGILNKIDKLGHDFDQWVYFITGSDRITKFECQPTNIFRDLLRISG